MCPEAVRALIDLTFKELGLHKIELTCLGTMSKVNESQRSLVSPMKPCIRDRKDAQGNRCDSLIYGLLRSEWEVQDQH